MRIRVKRGKRRCPLCRDGLGESEVQPCTACGTEYHRACLSELGGCSTLGCRRRGEVSTPAEATAAAGFPPGLLAHPAVTALSGHALKVDLVTTLEALWIGGACLSLSAFALMGMLALSKSPKMLGAALIPAAVAALFGWLASQTDNYYVIDFGRRELLYNSKLLSRHSLRRVVGFDDLAGFAVDCEKRKNKSRTWYVYFVNAIHRDGTRTRLTDDDKALANANLLAEGLAERSGTPAWTTHSGFGQRATVFGGALHVRRVPAT